MNVQALEWTLIAAVGIIFSAWASQDNLSSWREVLLAISLKRAVRWGPRWWMGLGFLVADLLFFLVWLGFAGVGAVSIPIPPSPSPERREAAETAGNLLLGLEAVLAVIQVWWRIVRVKLRGSRRLVAAIPAPDLIRLEQVAAIGRPLLHAVLGDAQLVSAAIEEVLTNATLSPEQALELEGSVDRLQHAGTSLQQLQSLIRALAPAPDAAPSPPEAPHA